MRRAIAVLVGVLLPFLGVAGVGQAQSAIQIQGTIQSVDCQSGTVVLSGPTGSNTIAASDYTTVLVNSTSVPFCTLQQYVGAPATAWLVAGGNEFEVTRIDVVGPVAVAYPPAPVVTVAPLPIVGVVLGTIAVAALLYLLVHDNDGHFYRYPYYGDYYRYYYRSAYRPYTGYWPQSAPVIVVPAPISGIVLGTTVVGGFEYLLARDHDGRVYRYPYYGPYHQYYYHAAYRPYAGDYHQAPLVQGDSHWTAQVNTQRQGEMPSVPVRQTDPAYHGVNQAPQPHQVQQETSVRQPAPAYRGPNQAPQSHQFEQGTPARQPAPAYHGMNQAPQFHQVQQGTPVRQPAPAYHGGNQAPQFHQVQQETPVREAAPTYHGGNQVPQFHQVQQGAPVGQPAPAYHGANQAPTNQQNYRGRNPSGSAASRQQCGGRGSNQGCSDGGRPAPSR